MTDKPSRGQRGHCLPSRVRQETKSDGRVQLTVHKQTRTLPCRVNNLKTSVFSHSSAINMPSKAWVHCVTFARTCWHNREYKQHVHVFSLRNTARPLGRKWLYCATMYLHNPDITAGVRDVRWVRSGGTSEKRGISIMVAFPRWNLGAVKGSKTCLKLIVIASVNMCALHNAGTCLNRNKLYSLTAYGLKS